MHRFFESIIRPALAILHPRVIVEIGIDEGFHTEKLLRYCKETGTILHAIDPEPHCDTTQMQQTYGEHFVFHRDLSLNALYRIDAYDVVLIDGDHNWYTVYHELLLIEKHAKQDPSPRACPPEPRRRRGRGQGEGHFPLVFLHDIGWPYGRRDLYYHPENIPAIYRHPYQKKGIIPGKSGLTETRGWNPEFSNAIYEHNVRNGVLTAAEDFLAQSKEALQFTVVPGFHGLGVLASSALISKNSALQEFLDSLRLNPPITRHIDALENVHLEHIVSDRRRRQEQYQTEQELERTQGERDALRGELESAQGQRDALRGELVEKNTSLKRVQEEAGRLAALLAERQEAITRMLSTRSWRWTALLRHAECVFRILPCCLLSAVKDIWYNLGAPCPRTARFVRHTLLGRLLPVRQPAPPPPPHPSISHYRHQHPQLPAAMPVAAIVVCTPAHHTIPPTIDSLLIQTQKPTEILVVDDSGSSDVHPAALAYAGRGIEYLHGSWRNRSAARNAGLACTESPLLTFLTAGDILPTAYIRVCAAALSTDSAAAIAYTDDSPYPFDALRLEQENIIPDTAMVRREALQAVGDWPEGLYRDTEWITWRRILAQGWRAVKVSVHVSGNPLPLGGRVGERGTLPSPSGGGLGRGGKGIPLTPSPLSSPLGRGDSPPLDATICLSLSGRAWMWPLTVEFLEQQTYPHDRTHLVIIDTSQESSFGETVRAWFARCDYGKHTYVPFAAGLKGLADLPRRVVKREVAEACAALYNAFVPYCTTPWVFLLEDDIIPPLDAFPLLLRHFDDTVVSVSALCMQRGSPNPIAWEWDEKGMPAKILSTRKGITPVGGNGLCCVVLRGQYVREATFYSGPFDLCHDHNFYRPLVCERGLKALLDWSCVCRHYVHPGEWRAPTFSSPSKERQVALI